MQVLLVSLNRLFRNALAQECRAVAEQVHCIESDDGFGAMFSPALKRMDLVLLDAGLVQYHGPAWLANWRRMAPHGAVVVFDPASEQTRMRVREAIGRILGRSAA